MDEGKIARADLRASGIPQRQKSISRISICGGGRTTSLSQKKIREMQGKKRISGFLTLHPIAGNEKRTAREAYGGNKTADLSTTKQRIREGPGKKKEEV